VSYGTEPDWSIVHLLAHAAAGALAFYLGLLMGRALARRRP